MSKRSPNLLIGDILDSAYKILEYTKDLSFENFLSDSKTVDAVIRNFEVIGKAANRLPEGFKDRYPSIEWHRIRGFRNRIIHGIISELIILSCGILKMYFFRL